MITVLKLTASLRNISSAPSIFLLPTFKWFMLYLKLFVKMKGNYDVPVKSGFTVNLLRR